MAPTLLQRNVAWNPLNGKLAEVCSHAVLNACDPRQQILELDREALSHESRATQEIWNAVWSHFDLEIQDIQLRALQ
jgi:hypothetical protein